VVQENFTFGSVVINGILNDGGKSISVKGDWTKSGTFTSTGSTTFSGNVQQNIGSSNFYSIAFSGNGTKVFSNNLTVSKNWQKNDNTALNPSGSLVTFNGATAQSISASNFDAVTFSGAGLKSLTGDVSLLSNAIISSNSTLDGGSSTIKINGDWTNNGTFTPSTSTLQFSKNGSSNFSGTNNTTAYNLSVNTLTTLAVDPSLKIIITGTLTENGYVSGSIENTSTLNSGSNSTFGGIGATITVPNGTTSPGLTTIIRTNGNVSSGFDGQVAKRVFIIRPANNNNLNLTLTLSYNELELNSQAESNLKLWRADENSSVWERILSTVDVTNNRITATNITKLSQWTFSGISVRRFTANGNAAGNWDVQENWNPIGIPTFGDSAYILPTKECIIPNNVSANVGSLSIEGTLTVTDDETLNVFGHFQKIGSGVFNSNNGLVNFNGSNQSIDVFSFHHLLFSGTGSQTIAGAMTIPGNVSILSNDTLNVGAYPISVQGNWSNSGIF